MRVLAISGGHHIQYIPFETIQTGLKLGLFLGICAMYSNLLIKISIALMLLRIKTTIHWKVGLWFLIASCISVGTAYTVTQLIQCRPVSGFWNIKLRYSGACWPTETVVHISYGFGGGLVETFYI
jgi:hypothetical protein